MRTRSFDITTTGILGPFTLDLGGIIGNTISWTVNYTKGSGTHSTQIEISADGTNWVPLGSAITATSTVTNTAKAIWIRFNVGGTTPVGSIQVVW